MLKQREHQQRNGNNLLIDSLKMQLSFDVLTLKILEKCITKQHMQAKIAVTCPIYDHSAPFSENRLR
jgi:hypothetical protein